MPRPPQPVPEYLQPYIEYLVQRAAEGSLSASTVAQYRSALLILHEHGLLLRKNSQAAVDAWLAGELARGAQRHWSALSTAGRGWSQWQRRTGTAAASELVQAQQDPNPLGDGFLIRVRDTARARRVRLAARELRALTWGHLNTVRHPVTGQPAITVAVREGEVLLLDLLPEEVARITEALPRVLPTAPLT